MLTPIKVLHVANLSLTPKGAGYFGVPFKLTNGLVRAGCNVMNFSDRDIARTATIIHNRKFGVAGANRKLLEVAQNFVPDMILFGHADTIRPETLLALRARLPGVKLVQWNVDPLFEPDNVARINAKIPHVDFTFVSTAGESLKALGQGKFPVAFLPNPVDPSVERARNFEHPREALAADVFFAAGNPALLRSHAGIEGPVAELVARLRAACPEFRISTPGCGSAPVFGRGFEEALGNAAMGLNISRRNDVLLYSSDRLAQMAGSGMLVFIDRATGYGDVFSEKCFAFYSTEAELFEKLTVYKADDDARRQVARCGWEAYRAAFDCRTIGAYIVNVVFGRADAKIMGW